MKQFRIGQRLVYFSGGHHEYVTFAGMSSLNHAAIVLQGGHDWLPVPMHCLSEFALGQLRRPDDAFAFATPCWQHADSCDLRHHA